MKILYIDAQNLYLGLKELGIFLDFKKFYAYCKHKKFDEVIIFLGYTKENKKLYTFLQSVGYKLYFKPTYTENGKQKANVDIDIAIKSISDHRDGILSSFSLISGDCDFASLIEYFKKHDIFTGLYVPNIHKTNNHLRKSCGVRITNLSDATKFDFLHKKMPSRND